MKVDYRQRFSYLVELATGFNVSQLLQLLPEIDVELAGFVDEGEFGKLLTYTYLTSTQIDILQSRAGIAGFQESSELLPLSYKLRVHS